MDSAIGGLSYAFCCRVAVGGFGELFGGMMAMGKRFPDINLFLVVVYVVSFGEIGWEYFAISAACTG